MCTQTLDLFKCGHVEKSKHRVSARSSSPEKCSSHNPKYERVNTVCFVCKMHGTEPPEDINVRCISSKDQVDPGLQETPVNPRMLEWLSALRPGNRSPCREVNRRVSPSQSSDTHQSTASSNLETQAYRSEDFHDGVSLTRYTQMNVALRPADPRIGSLGTSMIPESDSGDRQNQVGIIEKAETEGAYIDRIKCKQEGRNVMNISYILKDETLVPSATNCGQVEGTEKKCSRHNSPRYIQMLPNPLKKAKVEIEPQATTDTGIECKEEAAGYFEQGGLVVHETSMQAQEIQNAQNGHKRKFASSSGDDFLTPEKLARAGNVQVEWVYYDKTGRLPIPKRGRGRPRGSRTGSDVWSVGS